MKIPNRCDENSASMRHSNLTIARISVRRVVLAVSDVSRGCPDPAAALLPSSSETGLDGVKCWCLPRNPCSLKNAVMPTEQLAGLTSQMRGTLAHADTPDPVHSRARRCVYGHTSGLLGLQYGAHEVTTAQALPRTPYPAFDQRRGVSHRRCPPQACASC